MRKRKQALKCRGRCRGEEFRFNTVDSTSLGEAYLLLYYAMYSIFCVLQSSGRDIQIKEVLHTNVLLYDSPFDLCYACLEMR
jgi:hypothetical protein